MIASTETWLKSNVETNFHIWLLKYSVKTDQKIEKAKNLLSLKIACYLYTLILRVSVLIKSKQIF